MRSPADKWREWKRLRAIEQIHVELFNDDRVDYAIPLTRGVLKRLSIEALHGLVANAQPERLEAIRWELTRRQGLPALRVAWAAFAVSALAFVVSVIWHN